MVCKCPRSSCVALTETLNSCGNLSTTTFARACHKSRIRHETECTHRRCGRRCPCRSPQGRAEQRRVGRYLYCKPHEGKSGKNHSERKTQAQLTRRQSAHL